MLASENTLRSAAPTGDVPALPTTGDAVVLAGGTLVELHPPRMGQVGLRVDHDAPAPIDEPGIGVADTILFIENREAVVADLFHFHRIVLPAVS